MVLKNRTNYKKLFTMLGVLFLCVCGYAQQRGIATYYSHRLHGVRMSDGTRYHRDSMTCAHKTYPLGTVLKVRNLNNDKEVYVKVTDRGPYGRNRIVDLSYAAAKELDIIRCGTARVEVEVAEPLVPYAGLNLSYVPQLKFKDPSTGKYVTLAEAKVNKDKELQKKAQQLAVVKLPKVKKEVPRYRILRNSLSAKSK